MNLGEILDRTLRIYRSNFIPFIIIASAMMAVIFTLPYMDRSWIIVQHSCCRR